MQSKIECLCRISSSSNIFSKFLLSGAMIRFCFHSIRGTVRIVGTAFWNCPIERTQYNIHLEKFIPFFRSGVLKRYFFY
jgi:hypothetical protein